MTRLDDWTPADMALAAAHETQRLSDVLDERDEDGPCGCPECRAERDAS